MNGFDKWCDSQDAGYMAQQHPDAYEIGGKVWDFQQDKIKGLKKQIQLAFIAIDDGEIENASRRLKKVYRDE